MTNQSLASFLSFSFRFSFSAQKKKEMEPSPPILARKIKPYFLLLSSAVQEANLAHFSFFFLSDQPKPCLLSLLFFFLLLLLGSKEKEMKTVPSYLSKKTKTLFSSPLLCCLGSQLGPLLPFLSQLPNGQPLLPFSSFLL